MINPFHRGLAWYKYERLQSDFLDAIQYFPFESRYKEIWSEHFSDLIVRIGNSIDNFFRLMLKDKRLSSFPHTRSLKNSKRKRDITYFRDYFEPLYQLSEAEVEVRYRLTTVYEEKIAPFEEFSTEKNPKWWTAYNHVKHEWFDHIREATLENTIMGLAGLFILNVLHKENQIYLIRRTNVIDFPYVSKRDQERHFMESMIGLQKGFSGWKVKAETPLFTHFFRIDKSAVESPIYMQDEE